MLYIYTMPYFFCNVENAIHLADQRYISRLWINIPLGGEGEGNNCVVVRLFLPLSMYCGPIQQISYGAPKRHSVRSLAFVRGIHWSTVNSPHKGPMVRTLTILLLLVCTSGLTNTPDSCYLFFQFTKESQIFFDDVVKRGFETPLRLCDVIGMLAHKAEAMILKRKYLHFDKIVIDGSIGRCQNENFQCSRWWKFRQNDDILVSVKAF